MTEKNDHAKNISILDSSDRWRLHYQEMPQGDWRRWVLRFGRGAGKTYTGSRTTNEVARDQNKIGQGIIGIIGRTNADARHTMVEGPSGILATAPSDFRPEWHPGTGTLIYPNKVKAKIFSADNPDQMGGSDFSWVWADEPAHWQNLFDVWMQAIEPALRIGWSRCMLTTTPTRNLDLKRIEGMDLSVTSRASTFDNPYLPEEMLSAFRHIYESTAGGRKAIEGEYLEENGGAP